MEWISPSVEATEARGKDLGKRLFLRPDWARHVFLFGEMGAGKTALTRGIAKGLGIDEPIASPTYALVNEYALPAGKTELRLLSHFDLYRGADASALALPEVAEALADRSRISVIEWSEFFPADRLPPARVEARLGHSENGATRRLKFRFFDSGIPEKRQIEALFEKLATPMHVRAHIRAVAKVADFFARRLEQHGWPVDRALVHAGALLHDVVRVCNFKHLDPACFHEEVTSTKRRIWQGLIDDHGHRHHADAGAEILRELGFVATADVVSRHNTASALLELTLEEKCVLLGDRHVLHETVVPLEKRMQDGVIRHNHNANPRATEIDQRIRAILAELCEKGAIDDVVAEIEQTKEH